jgi:hypothetical protein
VKRYFDNEWLYSIVSDSSSTSLSISEIYGAKRSNISVVYSKLNANICQWISSSMHKAVLALLSVWFLPGRSWPLIVSMGMLDPLKILPWNKKSMISLICKKLLDRIYYLTYVSELRLRNVGKSRLWAVSMLNCGQLTEQRVGGSEQLSLP